MQDCQSVKYFNPKEHATTYSTTSNVNPAKLVLDLHVTRRNRTRS